MHMRSLTNRFIAPSPTAYPLKIRPSQTPPSTAAHATYNNEAENLYKGIPLSSGLINKRLTEKQMSKENKEFVSAMKLAEDEDEKEMLLRRETRTAPTNNEEVVEYFLNTMSEDMEFEVSRYRPMLDDGFFRHLDSLVGGLRFSTTSEDKDEEGLLELEGLRDYLTRAVKLVDQAVTKVSSAKDRVTRLLTSRDKKELILQMAEGNEIDHAFMIALDSNIQAARMAGQEEPAKFMEKVRDACAKYYVPPASSMPPPPAPPPSQATIDVQAMDAPVTPQAIADIAAKAAREASRKAANGLIIPGVSQGGTPGGQGMKKGGGSGGGGANMPSGLIIPGR